MKLQTLRNKILQNPIEYPQYQVKEGYIYFIGRIMLDSESQLIPALLSYFHDTPWGGHSGILRTYKRQSASYYWHGMKGEVNYVASCHICNQVKYIASNPAGLS